MSRSQVNRPKGRVDLGGDDRGCTILHVDMDAFYASVAVRDDPALAGLPVIVGGRNGRGVVLSATYEARAMGIHSAMPVSRAERLAPTAVFVAPDFTRYSEVSRSVMGILGSVTDLVEPISIDEAFLDVAGAQRRLGGPATIAETIRRRVREEEGITCSVGVATTKFVAKVASARAKPDGMLVIPADRVVDFLHPLPIDQLWGVGARTAERLDRLGMVSVGDVAHAPVATLVHALGPAAGTHLHDLAWGRDARAVTPGEHDRTVGTETTFSHDLTETADLEASLLALAHRVASRLRAGGWVARTVSIKVRFADFTTITRSHTMTEHTDVGADLYGVARTLLGAARPTGRAVRLLGVRAEGLARADETPRQGTLDAPDHGQREAEVAVDDLRARFGSAVVRPARLIGGRSPRREAP